MGKYGSNRPKDMGLYRRKILPTWVSHVVSNLFIVQTMVLLHTQERNNDEKSRNHHNALKTFLHT
ncbi:hypothetical protein EON65_04870 [archaeon]|nr:MAG: hypothetical protein EON65_04870 [archaeon]